MSLQRLRWLFCACLAISLGLWAQQTGQTNARPLTKRQEKKKAAQLRKELQSVYGRVMEEIEYIITDEERSTFNRLGNDEEREQFLEQFWLRRDPSPDTVENEYKEEHYRRIAYANEHFASGIPGWRTDRGRIYIAHGAPDEITDHSSGGFYERPPEEGGGPTSTYPFQIWRYRHLDGVGDDINLEFVDRTMSGEFRLTIDPSEKDALLYVPGAGLTWMEQMGLASKSDRFNRPDGTHLATAFGGTPESMNEFSRLSLLVNAFKPPPIKYRDLEDVTSTVRYDLLPFRLRSDFYPLTETAALTSITVQVENRDLQFRGTQGIEKAMLHILGEITSMTGRRVNFFEAEVAVDSPTALLAAATAQKSIFNRTLPLTPGTYRLRVTVKDMVAGTINRREMPLAVPALDAAKLGASSLMLADRIERVDSRSVGTGQFIVGDTKIRPRMDAAFHRDEKMGVYLRLYNLGADKATHKPTGQVTYEVRNRAGAIVLTQTDDLSTVPGASASQVTLQKMLDLQLLAPGAYTIHVRSSTRDEIRRSRRRPNSPSPDACWPKNTTAVVPNHAAGGEIPSFQQFSSGTQFAYLPPRRTI
jgi:GWxTD domain-containing protein